MARYPHCAHLCIPSMVSARRDRGRIPGALADNRLPAAPDGAPAGMLPIDYWDAWGEGGREGLVEMAGAGARRQLRLENGW